MTAFTDYDTSMLAFRSLLPARFYCVLSVKTNSSSGANAFMLAENGSYPLKVLHNVLQLVKYSDNNDVSLILSGGRSRPVSDFLQEFIFIPLLWLSAVYPFSD